MKNALSLMSVLFTMRWVTENCPNRMTLGLDAETVYRMFCLRGVFLLSAFVTALGLMVASFVGVELFSKTVISLIGLYALFILCAGCVDRMYLKRPEARALFRDWSQKRKNIKRVKQLELFKEGDNKNELRGIFNDELRHLRLQYVNLVFTPGISDHSGYEFRARELYDLAVYCGLTNRKFEEFWS